MMVGVVIKGVVTCGYIVTGGYGVATVIRYVRDYKDAIAKERV